MAKQSFTIQECGGCLKGAAKEIGWVLCVGAGVSLPLFPKWDDLTRRLLEWHDGTTYSDAEFDALSGETSYDALIEAIYHRTKLPNYNFAQTLSSILYSDLKTAAGSRWPTISEAVHTSERLISANMASDLLQFVSNQTPQCSALALAEVVSNVVSTDQAPSSILSFNVEPLLYSLIIAHLQILTQSMGPKIFDVSVRGISNQFKGRIPFYYVHGLLPLSGIRVREDTTSIEKLVFTEGSYLEVAGSMFSWQSAVFLQAALSRSIVFAGVSFSDPNLRRWLGFVHSNRIKELDYLNRGSESSRHFWIKKKVKSARTQEWIEASVAHLGVRPVWIDDWSQSGEALKSMLGS